MPATSEIGAAPLPSKLIHMLRVFAVKPIVDI